MILNLKYVYRNPSDFQGQKDKWTKNVVPLVMLYNIHNIYYI